MIIDNAIKITIKPVRYEQDKTATIDFSSNKLF